MLKKYAKKFVKYFFFMIICAFVGRFVGFSAAIYQNKNDAEIYFNQVNQFKTKACMIQTEEGSESEMNCIEFIDPSSYSYSI